MTRREKDPTAPLNYRAVPTGETVPATVRISPDAEHRSWRNEYVQLTPVDHRVEARLQLYAGKEGGCVVRAVTLQIDLRTMQVTLPTRFPRARCATRPPSRASGSSPFWQPRGTSAITGPASRAGSSDPGSAVTLPAGMPDAGRTGRAHRARPAAAEALSSSHLRRSKGRQPLTGALTNSSTPIEERP